MELAQRFRDDGAGQWRNRWKRGGAEWKARRQGPGVALDPRLYMDRIAAGVVRRLEERYGHGKRNWGVNTKTWSGTSIAGSAVHSRRWFDGKVLPRNDGSRPEGRGGLTIREREELAVERLLAEGVKSDRLRLRVRDGLINEKAVLQAYGWELGRWIGHLEGPRGVDSGRWRRWDNRGYRNFRAFEAANPHLFLGRPHYVDDLRQLVGGPARSRKLGAYDAGRYWVESALDHTAALRDRLADRRVLVAMPNTRLGDDGDCETCDCLRMLRAMAVAAVKPDSEERLVVQVGENGSDWRGGWECPLVVVHSSLVQVTIPPRQG